MSQKLDQVKNTLGSPVYERPGVLIYNLDCLEGLRCLLEPCFDLVVTSPPYNIGKEYETVMALDEYVFWCRLWLMEVGRNLLPRGQFWLNVGHLNAPGRAWMLPIPYLLWDKVPMFLQQEVVWAFGCGNNSQKGFSSRNEKWLWYVKNSDDYVFNLDAVRDPNVADPDDRRNNPLGKNPTDVWRYSTVQGNSRARHDHPCQFPQAMIERIITACSNPGDVVLDPFMGSGTVAEAALKLGREVVGFEIDAKYVEVIRKRLEGMSLGSLSAFEV